MPRWEQGAEERLRETALELFTEYGYENVTVAQITERAGLTRRTFSRYFADKRDVLFAGSERLPAVLAEAVRGADAALTPAQALLDGLERAGAAIADRVLPHAAQRRAIVRGSSELMERERTKYAVVSEALAEVLAERGAGPSTATLLADVGVAVFHTAFSRWIDDPQGSTFPARLREAGAELSAALMPLGK